MDRQIFDRLTRRVSAATSRRQAVRTVLGAVFFGAATTHTVAVRRAPKGRGRKRCVDETCPLPPGPSTRASKVGNEAKAFCCSGTHCSCNGECCNNRCFWDFETNPTKEFCCTGPEWVICGEGQDATCRPNTGENSCVGPTVITGSYRRR